MDCPAGHGVMHRGDVFWTCGTCGAAVPLSRLMTLVPVLPTPVAIVIEEYVRQSHPYLRLHAICSASEITARFLTAVFLAEVQRQRPDQEPFPATLVATFLDHLERPTLGGWRVLLNAALKALPNNARDCLLPELPEFADRFIGLLGAADADPLEKLLPMRNRLAHGGRFAEDTVSACLQAHEPRFEGLLADLSLFSADRGVFLLAVPTNGPARRLQGVSWATTDNRTLLPQACRQADHDRLALLTLRGVLDLCPLLAFGEASPGEDALHVYSRLVEPAGVEYTTLGSRTSFSRGQPAWEARFRSTYRLDSWRAQRRTQDALERYSFHDRIKDLLRLFIARDEQVKAAAQRIGLADGVLWLAGKPGMGKSAFLASLVRDHLQRDERLICIPYFFQGSDAGRCCTSAFAEACLLHLARATGRDLQPDSDPHQRINQLPIVLTETARVQDRKIVVVIDGIDEALGDGLLLGLIFQCRLSGVVLVCAGRDEAELQQHFRRERCGWFFERQSPFPALRVDKAEEESLLPPLRADDVRGYFIEELGHRLPQFFGRDRRAESGKWANEYAEEVIRRSHGLPLYLKLLVAEIRRDTQPFAPGSEQRLPHGLEEFYDRIVEEMGDDLRATMPAVTTLLALAQEPLPLESLRVLLADHELVGQPDGPELLEEALRHGAVMLRQATTAVGVVGSTPYHESFRQHLLATERVRRSRNKAQQRLCRLALDWSDLDASPARSYALRYGPLHLVTAGWTDEAVGLLLDLPFLEAKTEAGMVFELLGDFTAIAARMNREDQRRRWLELIEEAIRRDIHFIARHPTALFQCLWNSCWWYDCSEAAHHYDPPKEGWGQRGAPWNRPGPKLNQRVEQWRCEKEARSPSFVWVRSLRPPEHPLGSGCLAKFQAGGGVTAVAISRDGSVLAAGGRAGVRIWEITTGREVGRLQTTVRRFWGRLRFSPDGWLLLSCAEGIRAWDWLNGNVVELTDSEDARRAAWSPDGTQIAAVSDTTLRLWDWGSRALVAEGHVPGGKLRDLAFFPDSRRLVTTTDGFAVHFWDSTRDPFTPQTEVEGWMWVAVSPCGTRVALMDSYKTVYLGEANTHPIWNKQRLEMHHDSMVKEMTFSPDGRELLTLTGDGYVHAWDLKTARKTDCWEAVQGQAWCMAVDAGGRALATGGDDGVVRLWDLTSRPRMGQLRGHRRALPPSPYDASAGDVSNDVSILGFSADGRSLYSQDAQFTESAPAIGTWDARTGEWRGWHPAAKGKPQLFMGESSGGILAAHEGEETVFRPMGSDRPVAHYPFLLNQEKPHPSLPVWVGPLGSHMHLVQLEGVPLV